MLSSLVEVYQRFGGIYSLHPHGHRVDQADKTEANSRHYLVACSRLAACLTCLPIPKMEAAHPYETSVNFCETTRPHIPEDNTIRHFFKLGVSVQSVYKLTLQEHYIAVKTINMSTNRVKYAR
jgi:hypothetical protein